MAGLPSCLNCHTAWCVVFEGTAIVNTHYDRTK